MTVPERIICLAEETVETLYLLGERDRIVGITGYAVRPPEARGTTPARTSAGATTVFERWKLELALFGWANRKSDVAATLPRMRRLDREEAPC